MPDAPQFTAYSTADLMSVVQILKRPTTGILSKFFPTIQQSDKDVIAFDVDEQKRYVAPYVHQTAPGRLRNARGQETRFFSPAYIKQKGAFNPRRAFTRAAGEAFLGAMTPQERLDMAIKAHLQDDIDAVDRRLELQAISGILNGKLTIVGDDYPSRTVDFQRNNTLNVAANTLTGSSRWDQAGSKPHDNLDDQSDKCSQLAGSATVDVIMDTDAWRAYKGNPSVKESLDLLKYDAGTLASVQPQQEGLVLRGQNGGYRIWTYAGWIYDPKTGTETKSLSGGYVLGVGEIDGVQHFGAIEDIDAIQEFPQGVPVPVYTKSWIEKDPSLLVVLTQSAPLVVPRRINACWAMKVLGNS